MTSHDFDRFAPTVIFIGFMIWIILRSNKAQKAATERTKNILSESQNGFQEAIELSRQQLQVSKELLEETKALRKSIEEQKGAKPIV